MKFTIVTVTWNSAEEVPELLQTSKRHLGDQAHHIFVDNASEDGTVELIRSLSPASQVIDLDENVGTAPANNIGVKEAQTDVVVLLNPDVLLVDDSLTQLAGLAGRERALFGARLLNEDHTAQISAFPAVAGWELAVIALVPGAAMPRRLRARCEPWRSETRVEAGWLSIACFAARRDLLMELGPFDERLPLYGEDTDLCLRAWQSGIPSLFVPEVARVVHYGNRSGAQAFSDIGISRKMEAHRWVARARLGHLRAAYDMAMQVLLYGTRWLAKAALRRDNEVEKHWLRAAAHLLRHRKPPAPQPIAHTRIRSNDPLVR